MKRLLFVIIVLLCLVAVPSFGRAQEVPVDFEFTPVDPGMEASARSLLLVQSALFARWENGKFVPISKAQRKDIEYYQINYIADSEGNRFLRKAMPLALMGLLAWNQTTDNDPSGFRGRTAIRGAGGLCLTVDFTRQVLKRNITEDYVRVFHFEAPIQRKGSSWKRVVAFIAVPAIFAGVALAGY